MNYLDYLRTDKFPHFWCSGCGNGIVLCAIARAFEELDLTLENTVVVTGIGCWGKADDYVRTNSFHGTHGRALAFATGIKLANPSLNVVVLMGDGELQEGQTWECVQTAGYYKLDNFVMVIDANGQQVEGAIEDQMTEEPLAARFESFGATCVTCDGHDIDDIIRACATEHPGRPLAVICRTRGTTGIPPLEKKWPFLHFVRIPEADRAEYQKIYDEL